MMQFIPGLFFLALVSAGVAAAAAFLLRGRWALPTAIVASVLLLKGWAMLAIGGVDPMFLLVVIGVATVTAAVVVPPIQRLRARAA